MPQSQTILQHYEEETQTTYCNMTAQSGKPGTIRESNQALGVRKAHYYVHKSSILLAGTGVRKVSSVACRLSPIKIHLSEYRKS